MRLTTYSRVQIGLSMSSSTEGPHYSDLTIKPFTAADLSTVAYDWVDRAGSDEFEVELSAVFEWCADHLVPLPGTGHAMQVYNTKHGRTQAILEMVDGKMGTMSKLLKIWVSPEFWPADRDPSVRTGFKELYAGILVNVIGDGMSKGTEEIRIYGRTEALLTILSALQSEWGVLNSPMSATMEGRWFVLRK